jgi:hypothetical protein
VEVTEREPCACGAGSDQPWSSGGLWGPLTLVCGILVVGLGSLALAAGREPGFGLALLCAVALSVVVLLIVEAVGGHRGVCLVTRSLWKGVCIPGLPVRVVFWFAI